MGKMGDIFTSKIYIKSYKKTYMICDEELRHEDRIYFTFLLSGLAVAVSLTYFLYQINKFNEEFLFMLIFPLAVLIFLFTFLRFIAVVFEDNVWRYISLHGLFFFVPLYLILEIYFFAIIKDYEKILNVFVGFLLLSFWFPQIPKKTLNPICNFLTNRLFHTSKYNSVISEYGRERINLMCLYLYVAPIYLMFFLSAMYGMWISLHPAFPSDLSLKIYFSFFYFLLIGFGGIFSLLNFRYLKKGEDPIEIPAFHQYLVGIMMLPILVLIELYKYIKNKF